MSNVLIGIIGVVLFIGLALAGALLLGSDFLTATSASKAAAVVQGLQQVGAAYAMNTVKTGQTITSDQGNSVVSTLISKGRLKSAPAVPIAGASAVIGMDSIGAQNSNPMGTIAINLGAAPNRALRDVCYAIEEQMGATNPALSVDAPVYYDQKVTTDRRMGCMWNQYWGAYVAYTVV